MCSGVRMVQAVATGVQVCRMDARDDDESLPWCTAPECAETWLCAEVRALRSVPEISVSPTTVIVDSGADISCLPTSFATCGRSARSSQQIALFDAQGGDLKVHQQRIVDFAATDRSGREVVIREKCLITSVTRLVSSKAGRGPAPRTRAHWLRTQLELSGQQPRTRGMHSQG